MFMKKKLLKLKVLMIVLLLNCLNSYAQDIPSTGEKIKADTNLVTIPIEYIRLANQKLIERNYLEEVNNYKDSIIVDYKNYIKEQEMMCNNYKEQLMEYNKINEDLNKSLAKQKKTTLVFGGVAGASIVIAILMSFVN